MKQDCIACTEPTKRPVGCWDGRDKQGKATHGYIYDCDSKTCPTALARRVAAENEESRRERARAANAANGIDVRKLRRLRIEARCTIKDLSHICQCSAVEYSAWETEKEPVPRELWTLLMAYLIGEWVEK